MSNKNTNSKKKKKITFPKVMLILAIALGVGLVGFVIFDKVTSSTVKAVSIEGAYSVLYVGNPKYDSVEHNVAIYPTNANQGFTALSSDNSVATVTITEEGKIRVQAVGEGSAQIVVRSKAKSSIKDSFSVVVKNTDVQDVTIYKPNNEILDTNSNIETINIQKDGLEHYISFDIDPIDANMDRLSVLEFNKDALENVWIDTQNKRLVVIPKTDIENKIVPITLGIFQNTTKGQTDAKKITFNINLVERTAYLKFSFAYDSNSGINFGVNNNDQNIVYLDPKLTSDAIKDFYVKVNIAYDKDFTNIGEFKVEDFQLSVSDTSRLTGEEESNNFVAFDYSSTNESAEYKDKNGKTIFTITKVDGGKYFKVVAGEGFINDETTSYKLSFVHKYTGDKGEVEVKYFEKNLLADNGGSITDWAIKYDDVSNKYAIRALELQKYKYAITNGSSVLLESNIDKGIEKGILSIYTVDKNGDDCSVFSNKFGDSITIEKFDKRIKIKAKSIISRPSNSTEADSEYNITVRFKFSATYWDDRYLNSYSSLIADGNWRDFSFVIDDFKEINDDDFKQLAKTSNNQSLTIEFRNSVGDLGEQSQSPSLVSVKSDLVTNTAEVVKNEATGAYIFKVDGEYYYLKAEKNSNKDGYSIVISRAEKTTAEDGKTTIVVNGATISSEKVDGIIDVTNENNEGKFQITFGFYNLTKTIHFTMK